VHHDCTIDGDNSGLSQLISCTPKNEPLGAICATDRSSMNINSP